MVFDKSRGQLMTTLNMYPKFENELAGGKFEADTATYERRYFIDPPLLESNRSNKGAVFRISFTAKAHCSMHSRLGRHMHK